MREFKIYDEPKSDNKIVRFITYVDYAGDLTLSAVDEDGEVIDKILWIIAETGRLELNYHINESIGLDLDEEGHIKIDSH